MRAGEAAIRAALLAQVAARFPATVCPSEVARALDADESAWRALMPAVRAVAQVLADAGRIEILQRGRPAGPPPWLGPIRLRDARRDDA